MALHFASPAGMVPLSNFIEKAKTILDKNVVPALLAFSSMLMMAKLQVIFTFASNLFVKLSIRHLNFAKFAQNSHLRNKYLSIILLILIDQFNEFEKKNLSYINLYMYYKYPK